MVAKQWEEVSNRVAQLPEEVQISFAERILEELEEREWQKRYDATRPMLRRMAQEAREEESEDLLLNMTCRDEILDSISELTSSTGQETFTILDVLRYMQEHGTQYQETTIRTHISSKMCANAPKHHADKTDDLERVSHGVYRLSR